MDLNGIKNIIGKSWSFGPYIPWSNLFLNSFGNKLSSSKCDAIFEKRYCKVMDKLKEICVPLDNLEFKSGENDGPIWVCWLQGETNMPEIPKACLANLRKFAEGREVKLIDLSNMHHYVDLGGKVIDLYRKGRIANFHLSDLLRMRLLNQYGGLWADATLLITAPFAKEWFENNFYSIKTEPYGRFISRNRWTSFCMAATKGSAVPSVTDQILTRYWESQSWHIDYFLLDSAINLAYESVEEARRQIDAVPINNTGLYRMGNLLCERFDEEKFKEITSDTSVFKLNWRVSDDPRLLDPDSVFSHIAAEG